ncbi:hypothetical protein M378DRAFT_157040 [Amanita muscaria Koide BX008]|uniref:Uncharacterized protein n=1 Tax=Amanita muscaria (strain Koide BX008) TaxID=946122 RepID=A0A0C2TR88_AMAMK|nr:hypothetical protein M378DRAFT_157040 [Amanita muscaria Koide BX008]
MPIQAYSPPLTTSTDSMEHRSLSTLMSWIRGLWTLRVNLCLRLLSAIKLAVTSHAYPFG